MLETASEAGAGAARPLYFSVVILTSTGWGDIVTLEFDTRRH
jgi:hypothetical protein